MFGSELHDSNFGGSWATASNHTWPALLSKQLNLDYHCYARPGGGNLEIANAVLDHIALNEPCIYVIGWTWPQRFNFRTQTGGRQRWATLMPGDNLHKDINKRYFSTLQSDYSDKLTHLIQVKTILDQLKSNPNNKFVMTYMDHLLLDPSADTSSPGINMLQAQCSPELKLFNGMNFLEWSAANNYPIGKNGHPLEAAHCAAAEYALNHFLV